jgi:hypothetical protein
MEVKGFFNSRPTKALHEHMRRAFCCWTWCTHFYILLDTLTLSWTRVEWMHGTLLLLVSGFALCFNGVAGNKEQ